MFWDGGEATASAARQGHTWAWRARRLGPREPTPGESQARDRHSGGPLHGHAGAGMLGAQWSPTAWTGTSATGEAHRPPGPITTPRARGRRQADEESAVTTPRERSRRPDNAYGRIPPGYWGVVRGCWLRTGTLVSGVCSLSIFYNEREFLDGEESKFLSRTRPTEAVLRRAGGSAVAVGLKVLKNGHTLHSVIPFLGIQS